MYSLVRIAIAAINVDKMVSFYNQVFDAQFQAIETGGGTFYAGQLAGLALTLIPNEVAQVDAKQNRQQLTFVVANLEEVLSKAVQAGGKKLVETLESPEGKQAAITDPDGNTIEFLEQPA